MVNMHITIFLDVCGKLPPFQITLLNRYLGYMSDSSNLKVNAAGSAELLLTLNKTTLHHISEDSNLPLLLMFTVLN
jgi:hypothetical protein